MKNRSTLKNWIVQVSLPKPGLDDNTADSDRIRSYLKKEFGIDVKIGLTLLKKIPSTIRELNFDIKCIILKDNDSYILTDIISLDHCVYGVAIDLGTTRIVFRLIDLETHEPINELSFDNPQIKIGPDILERIHFAHSVEGLDNINKIIIDGFNYNLAELIKPFDISIDGIYFMAVAGNTAMTHLFLGIDPSNIIREPYIPAVNTPGLFDANDLNIRINPNGKIFVFPNIGSYFGGDLISGILYSEMHKRENPSILVDVGTNAEVVLGNKDWLMACAGAAGPALEGGVSKMGMMAGPGVIDSVEIDHDSLNFQIHTIEQKTPRGICGSGLIDLAAQLFLSGLIDIRGKFSVSKLPDRFKVEDGVNSLVLVPASESATGSDLLISQIDMDSLIRSKAAMYTILSTISASVELELNDFEIFFIAGTFGSFIRPESAISIGMIPDIEITKYRSLGNSSLGGAEMVLKSPGLFDDIDKIRNSITYMELNVNQAFMNSFSGAKFLPHTNPDLFPSVKIRQN
jgi:uncharacterized 2Fe-2S/4Fe-4S cluster protein (DUF4445 family)